MYFDPETFHVGEKFYWASAVRKSDNQYIRVSPFRKFAAEAVRDGERMVRDGVGFVAHESTKIGPGEISLAREFASGG